MESTPSTAPSPGSIVDLLASIEARARSMVFRYGLHPEDADDLLQEVAIIFLRKRAEIYSAEAWLLSTLRSRCLMLIRNRYKDAAVRVDRVVLEEIAACRDNPQALCDLRSDLDRALEGIEGRCGNILRLRYLDELRPLELARKLGYKSSGIYKILERCVEVLGRKLLLQGFPLVELR